MVLSASLIGAAMTGVAGVEPVRTMMTTGVENGKSVSLVHLNLGNANIFEAMVELDQQASVRWSSPNFYQHESPIELVPNDPEYGTQYHHPLMQNDLAWDLTLGDPSVIIGVTDDGVELGHVDLAAEYLDKHW